jgi:hypothetical protein
MDASIDVMEDEQTTMAKEDAINPRRRAIDTTQSQATKATSGFIQKGINTGLSLRATMKQAMRFVKADKTRVRFAPKITTAEAQSNSATVIAIYNLGAEDNYLCVSNRARVQMPIL